MSMYLSLSHTSSERTYVEASKLVEDGEALSKLIEESYLITDWISKDYPNHLKHFYCKYVPGIFWVSAILYRATLAAR